MKRALKFAPLLLFPLLAGCTMTQNQPRTELRGLWVDAFGPGLKTPEEITQLVSDAKKMNVNVLFAQIGRRGDCYCNNAAMPRTDDKAVPEGFDPLADLLTKAHAAGIQVHAWIITTALWNSATPPTNPAHAFNTHGPTAQGRDNWLTLKMDGTVKSGADWVLDPGHPDAAEYIKNMYVSVVKNYDVDGIQFDRVRYPDGSPTGGPLQWGYNPTALERFRAETGATGTPDPADPAWGAWRRQQVTHLVRETALAVKAVRPNVSVNAATITYGAGPESEDAFAASRPSAEVGQDWREWVRQGYLDINVMMNYKREFVPAQKLWFDQWNAFAASLLKKYPHTAQVSGSAIYLNDQNSSVSQAAHTQAAGLSGWAMYSYRTPDREVNAGRRKTAEVIPELTTKLTSNAQPLMRPATWPHPSTANFRALSGKVTGGGGAIGGKTVQLLDASTGNVLATTQTDGNGNYGFMHVPDSAVVVQAGSVKTNQITAQAGSVTVIPVLEYQ